MLSTTLLTLAAGTTPIAAPPQDLDALRQSLGVDAWDDQLLALPYGIDRPLTVPLELDGQTVHLEIAPGSVRAADFRMFVQTDGVLVETEPPPPCTFRGTVAEWSGSRVAGSIHAGEMRAMIREPDGRLWAVEPVSGLGRVYAPGVHVAYADSSLEPTSFPCPVREAVDPAPPTVGFLGGTPQVAEVAVDADYEYFTLMGSVTLTQIAMDTRIAVVSLVYEVDFDMSWVISNSIIRSDPNDAPYAGYGGSYATLASLVAAHWRDVHPRKHRDAVHLFSDKPNDFLGYAVGGVCSCTTGAVSREGLGLEMYRTILVAHELGHVMGASHCNGTGDCFIMCSGNGGCDGPVLDFGSQAEAQIGAKVANAPCITETVATTPPVLTGLNPPTAMPLGTNVVVVQGTDIGDSYYGTVDFGGSSVSLEGCDLTPGTDTFLTIPVPTPPALGPASVRLGNVAGLSNAVTLTYVETSPPLLLGPGIVNVGPTAVTWNLGAGALDDVRILMSFNDSTTFQTATGITVLANASVVATPTLDNVGLYDYTRTLGANLENNTLYTQFVVVDSSGTITASSNIVSTSLL